MRRAERLVAGLLLAAVMAAAVSQALPPDTAQRGQSLPSDAHAALQARQATLDAMSGEQRTALAARIAAWDAQPLAQRRQRRERWEAWQALPPGEQRQVRAAAIAFTALPAEEQQSLRSEFEALDGSVRHGWLLGPVLGADYAPLQPLLAQVPAAQRMPLLETLRTMTPEQRRDLAILAQRTPPQERVQLRRDLLSTSVVNRSAWLRGRLDR